MQIFCWLRRSRHASTIREMGKVSRPFTYRRNVAGGAARHRHTRHHEPRSAPGAYPWHRSDTRPHSGGCISPPDSVCPRRRDGHTPGARLGGTARRGPSADLRCENRHGAHLRHPGKQVGPLGARCVRNSCRCNVPRKSLSAEHRASALGNANDGTAARYARRSLAERVAAGCSVPTPRDCGQHLGFGSECAPRRSAELAGTAALQASARHT